MPEIIGLEPLAGTADWILVDHCWVNVSDVQRLLDEAVAPAVARVFASVDGRPLVAHLAATDAVRTPEQAHARCMTALARHTTAITPRHYVICPTAPPDPADPAAWPPPLAAGTPTIAGRPDQRRVAGAGAVVGGRRDGRAARGRAHQDQPVRHRAGGRLRGGRPTR